MKKTNDIFLDMLPQIDLHGYDRDSAVVAVNDFILENIQLKNKKIIIIHGIGEGILKKAVKECLERNKYVQNHYIDNFNIGCTIVNLNIDN